MGGSADGSMGGSADGKIGDFSSTLVLPSSPNDELVSRLEASALALGGEA